MSVFVPDSTAHDECVNWTHFIQLLYSYCHINHYIYHLVYFLLAS